MLNFIPIAKFLKNFPRSHRLRARDSLDASEHLAQSVALDKGLGARESERNKLEKTLKKKRGKRRRKS